MPNNPTTPARDNSYPTFVRTWQESGSISEVCQKLSRTRANVDRTAAKLRQQGVKLKSMRTNAIRGAVDVDALNALIAGDADDDADDV